MEKHRGFDYLNYVKLYGYGKSVKASDPELKEKLRAQYEQIKKETGLELDDVSKYCNSLSGADFETNFEYFVEEPIKNGCTNITFRICEIVSANVLTIYDSRIAEDFEDECEWNEETERSWDSMS